MSQQLTLRRKVSAFLLACALLSALVLALAPMALAASVVYVRPDGSDTACDGTVNEAAPGTVAGKCAFKTIQKGIAAVDSGGTVNVAAGNYTGAWMAVNKPVTLLGAQANVEPVAGGRAGGESVLTGHFEIYASNVTINGFEIKGGYFGVVAKINGASLRENGNILYNYIHDLDPNDHDAPIVLMEDQQTAPSGGVTFKNWAVSHNRIAGDKFSTLTLSGGADKEFLYDGLTISHNDITNPNGFGIFCGANQEWYEIHHLVLTNNNIHGVKYMGVNLGNLFDANISNNTLTNTGEVGMFLNVVGGTIDGNVFSHSYPNAAGGPSWALRLENDQPQDNTFSFKQTTKNLTVSNNTFNYNQNSAAAANGVRVRPAVDVATVSFTGNSFVDGGANAGAVAITNEEDSELALGGTNTFDGVSLATASTGQLFAVADKISDGLDVATNGHVRLKAGNVYVTQASGSIQRGMNVAVAGDVINVAAGTYVEPSQLVVAKNLSIAGADKATTIIKPAGDTGSARDDTRGWFLVNGGKTFNLSNVTLDGQGKNISIGILTHGSGAVDNVAFKNLIHPGYAGRGISTGEGGYPGQVINVNNSTFENIGRIGVHARGDVVATITNSVYTGKGVGDWLDYAFEASGGARVTVTNSAATNCKGVASVDGSTSAGMLATTYWGAGTTLTVSGSTVTGNTTAIAVGYNSADTTVTTVHTSDLSGNTYGISSMVQPVNAENNWWGSACGPASGYVSGPVDYSPWWLTSTGAAPTPAAITAGMSASDQCAQINSAAPNTTLTYGAGAYPGGVVIAANDVTIDLNGAEVGPGSPAYTIIGNDVTLQNGTLNGALGPGGASSPAVLVQPGAHNFALKKVEVKNWLDGVQVAGAVTSLKIVNNYIHNNTDAGLQVDGAVAGVQTVEGNLFKANGGDAIKSVAALKAQYNSFAASGACPTYTNVDATNCTFAETFIDVDADTAGDQFVRNVDELQSFNVHVVIDAQKLYGYAFKFSYDSAKLQKNTANLIVPGGYACFALQGLAANQLGYQCSVQATGASAVTGRTPVMVINFTATGGGLSGPGPWDALFDVDPVASTAGTANGALVYLNNVKLAGLPNARDITETTPLADDGKITIRGVANFTGFIDVQGRADDSGASMSVYAADTLAGPVLASATSAKGGAYTTAYTAGNWLTIGTTYHFLVDKPLYVKTWTTGTVPNKELSTRALTTLDQLVLKGGDATNDEQVELGDATCIGSAYGTAGGQCGVGPTYAGTSSDVNGDGKVDILDLTLMGGNYGITASDWTP